MPETYSSAGLLYVYLNGYEEDGMICAQPIDSYRHIGEGLYDSIMEAAADLAGSKYRAHHQYEREQNRDPVCSRRTHRRK